MEEKIKKLEEVIVSLEKIIETYQALAERMAREIEEYKNIATKQFIESVKK
jgi:hypothetical protein